jgi:hypothetical protein
MRRADGAGSRLAGPVGLGTLSGEPVKAFAVLLEDQTCAGYQKFDFR